MIKEQMKELIILKQKEKELKKTIKKQKQKAEEDTEIPLRVEMFSLETDLILPVGFLFSFFLFLPASWMFFAVSLDFILLDFIGLDIPKIRVLFFGGIPTVILWLFLNHKARKKIKSLSEKRKELYSKNDPLRKELLNVKEKYSLDLCHLDFNHYNSYSLADINALPKEELEVLKDYKKLLKDSTQGQVFSHFNGNINNKVLETI
tara:strand:- start:3363 stop:3977 length:615 start_codon:yes stop_codon:yes gene_type:complete